MKGVAGFNRPDQIRKLSEIIFWDIIIIGGGATGLGVAVDAASRGYKTLLLEQVDFAKGTSSRSTKLVHGGVRYLAQGDIKLVYSALKERGLLLKNAPHLVKAQDFIIPCFDLISKYKYLVGLKLYDWLSGRFSFGRSKFLKKETVLTRMPTLRKEKLVGGVQYFDRQFDDARLAINLAQTSVEDGGTVLNHFKVTDLLKENGRISGVRAVDIETGTEYQLKAKTVVNATGVFVDDILQLDNKEKKPLVSPSQGVHVVLDMSFLNSSTALMIPKTADGRVLFAIPWHEHLLVGTTDTLINKHSLEPKALEKEISFILDTVGQYLTKHPEKKDILSIFAGLRPLAAPKNSNSSTKEISRDHKLMVSESGLITITGGKWTTYRKMAEETVDEAIKTGGLTPAICVTMNRKIHAWTEKKDPSWLAVYGDDAAGILELIEENKSLGEKLVTGFDHTEAEVVWAVHNEMARTVEDILARRMRILFLDAKAAMEAAPRVAEIMCRELNYDEGWIQTQLHEFFILADQYLAGPRAVERSFSEKKI